MAMSEAQLRRLFEVQAHGLKYSVSRGPNGYVSTKTETLWLGFQLGVFVIAKLQDFTDQALAQKALETVEPTDSVSVATSTTTE